MLKIDFEHKLSEKNAKVLKTSLNLLIDKVGEKLKNCLTSNNDMCKFSIDFNNKESFIIRVYVDQKDNDNILIQCAYFDAYNKRLNTISLNQALNINKYVANIQNQLNYIKDDTSFQGCFTQVSLSQTIAIFAEHNIDDRFSSYINQIDEINIKYDENEPDL
jgi:hypothetical protein